MNERIWLKSYPPGVPADIDPAQYNSLVELTAEAMAKHAEHKAYVLLDHAVTYREVDNLAAAFAAWLQAQGFNKGDRIALMLPNVPQYPVAMLGALRAGLVVVNTNPLYTADELRHQLQDSGATAVLVLENFAHVVQAVAAETKLRKVIVTGVGDLLPGLKGALVNFVLRHVKRQVPAWSIPGALRFRDLMHEFAGRSPAAVTLGHADLAFLQYTGGTTGVAKGAMLSHGNMVANVLQAHAWFSQGAHHVWHVLHRAAAVPHLFADRELPAVHARGRHRHHGAEPARLPGLREAAAEVSTVGIPGREHVVQRAHEYTGLRQDRFQQARGHGGRRHGRTGCGRRALVGAHRQASEPGLGTYRDITSGLPCARCRIACSPGPWDCRCLRPMSLRVTMKAGNWG